VKPDGTDARPLEVQPFGDSPIWSPDGGRIATTHNNTDGTGVYLTGEGTHLELFYSWDYNWTVTDWSDDGSMLLLAGSGWGQFETSDDLYLFRLADKSVVRLTAGDANSGGVFWPSAPE
jgi:Tol biopolymer transport system component